MLMSLLSYPEAQYPKDSELTLKQGMEVSSLGVATPQQQQQLSHINQLLSTAAAGNGVVGDVDALMQPLAAGGGPAMLRLDQRPERNLWRTDEMMEMLNTMQQLNAIELLNDKSVKSEKVFRNVEELMNKKGFCKKSHVQIWTKWKFLKSTYTTSKRNGFKPKMIAPQIYDILHNMLSCNSSTSSNNSTAGVPGDISECGNSRTSMDNDSCHSARLTSGGTEGSFKATPNKTLADSEEENGLAHPIFGFRLGLVKQEPLDTGYESMANGIVDAEESVVPNNKPHDLASSTTAHLQFRTEIKQEPPRAQKPMDSTSSNPPTTLSSGSAAVCPAPTLRDDPPTPAQRLPALRIAQFAKESALNTHEASMPSSPAASKHHLRISNVQTACDMIQPRKPYTRASHSVGNTQFPKEIMVQPRVSSMPTTQLRLKNMAMRRAPYALRPERLVPEAEASSEFNAFNSYAHPIASSSQVRQPHKRALPMPTPIVLKKRRRPFYETGWSAASATPDEEDEADSEEELRESSLPRASVNGAQKSGVDKEIFTQLLKGFTESLREMQREMINDFFRNQMQLARKEHEFQMKQDMDILHAFKKQSEEIFATVRSMIDHRRKDYKEQSCQTEAVAAETKKPQPTVKAKKEEHKINVRAHLANGHAPVATEHTEDDDSDSEAESTGDSSYTTEEQPKQAKLPEAAANNKDADDDDDYDDDDDDDVEHNTANANVDINSAQLAKEQQLLQYKLLPNRSEASLISQTLMAE